MKLEEAIKYLKKISEEYKTYGDLDNPEFEDIKKIPETIETVLQVIEDTQKENSNLKSYLSKQGLISDYIKFVRRENK